MYDRLLFPTDGSEGAAAALDHALDLAAAHDATLHVLNVADTTRDSLTLVQGDVVDALEREGERIVEAAADRARSRGVDVVTAVLQGEPDRTIVDYAADRDVDLVVLPTHGRRGIERILLGSTTERVVRRSTVPVLTLRPGTEPGYPYRDVLVPTDGSDCAAAALAVGADLATAAGATLHLLSVVDVASLGIDVRTDLQADALEERATEVVGEAAKTATDAGVESVTEAVESGASIHGTVEAYVAAHGVDVVVLGTHGRTGVDRYLLGSVAEKLVRTSPVPVLTVRAPDEASTDPAG
ncbi:MAG: universal stress protein [Haloarculaceae archaeon]